MSDEAVNTNQTTSRPPKKKGRVLTILSIIGEVILFLAVLLFLTVFIELIKTR